LIWPPALLIILTVLAFNLLGDALRDALDPRALQRDYSGNVS
jgi:peptide/nickel transport system permease protein